MTSCRQAKEKRRKKTPPSWSTKGGGGRRRRKGASAHTPKRRVLTTKPKDTNPGNTSKIRTQDIKQTAAKKAESAKKSSFPGEKTRRAELKSKQNNSKTQR